MDVKLPKLGEGAESGTVVSLLVREGDSIRKGQTLLELENEKAVAPIPSPAAGTVTNIRVKEGDRLSVGQVILVVIEGDSAASAAAKPAVPTARSVAAPIKAEPESLSVVIAEGPDDHLPASSGLAPAASPSIRRMARELGIDLTRVRGSEAGGRIVLADLRAHVERLQRLAFQSTPASAVKTAAPLAEPIDFSKWGDITKKPMSALRKTISRRMLENWNSVPHVTQFDEADITALTGLRKKYAPAYETKGARLTLTSFALKAVVAALKQHPIFNASLDEAAQEIVFKEYYHIGLAVDTDQGLIVPVLRDVDKKSLLELSQEVSVLAEKARARKVSLEELKGGTFTISNQGGIGGAHFTPIINKPEVAILGLGLGVMKAAVRDGKIEPRLLLPIGVSYDHRIIDGGTAARFTVDLVQALEQFNEADVKI